MNFTFVDGFFVGNFVTNRPLFRYFSSLFFSFGCSCWVSTMICLQKNVETLEPLDFFPFIVFSSTLENFTSPDTDYPDAGDVSRGPRGKL